MSVVQFHFVRYKQESIIKSVPCLGQGNIFTSLCHSVRGWGEGGSAFRGGGSVSRGVCPEGSASGRSAWGRVEVLCIQGGFGQSTLPWVGQGVGRIRPPPPVDLEKWTVRILLEWFLVKSVIIGCIVYLTLRHILLSVRRAFKSINTFCREL